MPVIGFEQSLGFTQSLRFVAFSKKAITESLDDRLFESTSLDASQ